MRIRLTPLGIVFAYAAFSVLWIVVSGYLLTVSVDDPVTQARIELVKGLAFVLVSSALLYVLLQIRDDASGSAAAAQPPLFKGMRRLFPALLGLALTVPVIGLSVVAVNSGETERDAKSDLGAIASLKASQIENWLAERRGDAETLAGSTGFIMRVAALQRPGGKTEEAPVRDRIAALLNAFSYDAIILLDARARPLLAEGRSSELPAATLGLVAKAVADGRQRMGELYRSPGGAVLLDFAVPLALRAGSGTEVQGVAVLRVNAARFLYPLIQSWPASSSSGETLLFRRDGDSVLFLNQLRFRDDLPLTLRLPLSDTRLVSVQAELVGAPGTASGADYRGAAVMAAYRPIAGTGWRIVAKLDRAEVMAPLYRLAQWVSLIGLLAALAVTAALVSLWRQQRLADGLALKLRQNALFKTFHDMPFVGLATVSPASRKWENANDQMCVILGYPRAELPHKTWMDVAHPEDRAALLENFDRVAAKEADGFTLDTRLVRKYGETVFATLNVRAVRDDDGAVESFFVTVQDITQRKTAEAALLRLNRLYAALGECNAAIMRAGTEQQVFEYVTRIIVDLGGMKMAWVGMVDTATRMIHPVAGAGDGQEYLSDLQISVDPASEFGNGPTGTAVREGRPFWCQNFQDDPATAPWHERGRQFGWLGSASLPLKRIGRAAGSLTVYAPVREAFDADAQNLLIKLAEQISFALDNFDREAGRRRAEAALRDSDARVRALIAAIPDMIFTNRRDGEFLACDVSDPSALLVPPEVFLHRKVTEVLPPAIADQFMRAYSEALDTGITQEVNYPLVVNEREKYFEARVVPAGADTVVSIVRDVSAQRQAQIALLESETRYRALIDTSLIAILLTDPRGAILMANAAACEMLGRTEEELRQCRRGELADMSDPRLATALKEREQSGRFRGELTMIRKSGEKFPAEISTSVFADAKGNLRTSMIIRDLTEAKLAQKQLIESEERLRGLIDQVISGIYIVQDGKIAYANRRFAEIAGYASVEEIIGRDALSMIAEPQRAFVAEQIRLRLSGEVKRGGYNTIGLRKDGTVLDIGVHGALASFGGKPAVIGMMQDISEKKRAEDQAARYLAQLQTAFMRTVEVATTISEMRDPYTAGHEKRVARIAMAIGAEMGFDEGRLEGLRVGGYLHDVGKITIPAEILAKPGKLSAVEYQLIKGHAQASYDILKDVEFPWPVAQMAYQHHERFDGSGYPRGLKGEEILLEARVMAVADTVEAMSSHRPYRAGLGKDKALDEIARGRGTAYDPQVADACLRLFREKGYALPD